MPLLGDTSRFAVQYELDEEQGGPWLFGKFCYWIGGQRVGNYELGTSLRDVLFQLIQVLRDKGYRLNDELFAMSTDELAIVLDRGLFGRNPSPYDERSMEEEWARHNLTLTVDIFDGWKVFGVESDWNLRIVVMKTDGSAPIRETLLRRGECDEVLEQTFRELDHLYELAGGK
jgi:hypothetical protein